MYLITGKIPKLIYFYIDNFTTDIVSILYIVIGTSAHMTYLHLQHCYHISSIQSQVAETNFHCDATTTGNQCIHRRVMLPAG